MPDAVPIQDVVTRIMKTLGADADLWTQRLADAWTDVAGQDVARHSRPGLLENGVLTVYVDSSVWLSEISRYGRNALLDNLRRRFSRARIREIRVRLDPDGGR